MRTNGDAELQDYVLTVARQALAASRALAGLTSRRRVDALEAVAAAIRADAARIESENAKDLAAAPADGLSPAMIDRLGLDAPRIEKMARAVEAVAAQPDPVGRAIDGWMLPDGIRIEKRRVPLGVVAIIYESRPNVTSDAAALCLKSGNACVLRGGKEAMHSNLAVGQAMTRGLGDADMPPNAVQVINTPDRALVPLLLARDEAIDLVIPRGGESLIRAVVEQSRIPVIKHYTGNCHVYVDARCDADKAERIVVNAKLQRTGVCNAAETILFHRDVAASLIPRIGAKLREGGCEIRGCPETCRVLPEAKAATDQDYAEEFLGPTVAVKVVASIDEAIAHINQYGSRHTDAVVTEDMGAADAFVTGVDSGNVMINCSTRFSDGGVYGLGAEIGISTDKLHARGPMGAADLTTYKYVVTGSGHIRES
jgi:glutamate-5-semialdehyde dehydrogenase